VSHLVLGLMYGDEGKGRMVSALCHKYKDINGVVRFSGGPQAAHGVMSKRTDFKHIYASLGSGSHLGKPTFITRDVMVNPETLMAELNVLESKRSKKDNKNKPVRLHISPEARLITPFDVLSSRTDMIGLHNGTTGMGVRKAIVRHELLPLYVKDVFHPEVLREKIANYYSNTSPWREEGTTDQWEDVLNEYMLAATEMIRYIDYDILDMCSAMRYSVTGLVYEGAQGILLDPNVGFFPNVTAAPVLPPQKYFIEDVWLVARAYSTRHGNGPIRPKSMLPNMLLEGIDLEELEAKFLAEIKNPHEINSNVGYQGDFRIAPFSATMFRYSLEKFCEHYSDAALFKRINIVITCMDCIPPQKGKVGEELKRKFLDEILTLFREVMACSPSMQLQHMTEPDPYRLYYTDSPYQEDFPKRFEGK